MWHLCRGDSGHTTISLAELWTGDENLIQESSAG